MLEQTRLDYLQAMGVAQWMPRHALPFAPEPRWLATVANQNPAAVKVQNAEANLTADMDELFGEQTPAQKAPIQKTEVQKSVAGVNPATQPTEPALVSALTPALDPTRNITPNFQLFFIGSSLPVIWVCDNVEEVELLQRFIYSVQKALRGQTDFVAQAFEFRWPFLQSNQQDQSLPVALQALKAHWMFMQQNHSAKGVVAIGPQSQQWLQQIGVKQIITAPSVSECLRSASFKRQLWQSLLRLL